MDLFRLGPRYTTSYLPDEPIEGYSTCIWNERFYTDGEFTLITSNIDQMRALLPEDTLISHRDTPEVMMVETHTIDLDEDDTPQLTIKGRSATSILAHRFIEAQYNTKRPMRKKYTWAAAAMVLMYNVLDNSSGWDVTRGPATLSEDDWWSAGDPLPGQYPWSALDKIPNACITDSVASEGDVRNIWLKEGLLLPQLAVLLTKARAGIRTIRPSAGSNATIITVPAWPLEDRGKIVRTWTPGITSLRFDVYTGINRSNDQNINPKVSFSAVQGDLDKAQYLWSTKDYKSMVEALSSVGITDTYRAGAATHSGFRRRVSQIDAGTPEYPEKPPKPADLRKNATKEEKEAYAEKLDNWNDRVAKWQNRVNAIKADFIADAKDDAEAEIYRTRPVAMVSGEVSSNSQFQYRRDYNLGDVVSLEGKYGLVTDAVVSEYIRTEDTNGDIGVPGLVVP